MSDLYLILRGGSPMVGTDLLLAKFTWTHRSQAAAQNAIGQAIPDIIAALYPEEADAPPCPKCGRSMLWSRDRRKWRCHWSHRAIASAPTPTLVGLKAEQQHGTAVPTKVAAGKGGTPGRAPSPQTPQGAAGDTPTTTAIWTAATVLAALVRDEYPEGYSLAEIAKTWGNGVTPEQIEALELVEATMGGGVLTTEGVADSPSAAAPEPPEARR